MYFLWFVYNLSSTQANHYVFFFFFGMLCQLCISIPSVTKNVFVNSVYFFFPQATFVLEKNPRCEVFNRFWLQLFSERYFGGQKIQSSQYFWAPAGKVFFTTVRGFFSGTMQQFAVLLRAALNVFIKSVFV